MFKYWLSSARCNQKGLDSIGQLQQRKLDRINQTVFIRDLTVRAISDVCGEAKTRNNIYPEAEQTRLRAHILALFALANEDHCINFCELDRQNNYQLRPDKANHVTRLSTNEFSFYTQTPLSLIEFQLLIIDIEHMAHHLKENVHVILSSFAVRDGRLLNITLFIQGGPIPVIHCFSKTTRAKKDIDYDMKLFSQKSVPDDFHAEFIGTKTGPSISNASIFQVETYGGARYIQAIDVCLDHEYAHSKNLLMRHILTAVTNNDEPIVPNQIEQCVTSHSIEIFHGNVVTTQILHVDHKYSMFEQGATKGELTLDESSKKRIIPLGYEQGSIDRSRRGYIFKNAPFGSNYIIEVLEIRPAGQYTAAFHKELECHLKPVGDSGEILLPPNHQDIRQAF